MKKWLICALALCLSPVSAQFTKPNFSGGWGVDPEKSTSSRTLKEKPGPDTPPSPLPAPSGKLSLMERIEHRGVELKIIRFLPEEKPLILIYTTDGKENVNQLPGGAGVQRSKSHWEGEKLVTEWELLRDGVVYMRGKDARWTTPDGRRMFVHSSMEDSLSRSVVHTEWKKQPGLLPLQ
jgi:hypothetical protein